MNVSECTPQSVGDIFGLENKGTVCIYWLIFFINKNWSDASKCTLSVFVYVNPDWSLNRKDGADRVKTLDDDLHPTAVFRNSISFARFLTGHRPGPFSPQSAFSAALHILPSLDLCIPLFIIYMWFFSYLCLFHVLFISVFSWRFFILNCTCSFGTFRRSWTML